MERLSTGYRLPPPMVKYSL